MKDVAKMALILGAVRVVATGILAGVEQATRGPIQEAVRQEILAGLTVVLPPFDNAPDQDTVELAIGDPAGGTRTVYRARIGKEVVGAAFVETAPDGYSGRIDILMGVTAAGVLSGIRVVQHAETPGLGDKIVLDHAWVDFFKGKALGNPDEAHWKVKKDGGIFDQFTGATITPRAVVKAVKHGLDEFQSHRLTILGIHN